MAKTLGYELKERNIIVNSNYAREHLPALYGLMVDTPTLSQLEAEKVEDASLRALLDKTLIQQILDTSRLEWDIVKGADGDYKLIIRPTRDCQCEICNTKIRNLYYIKNRLTMKELCVGSECIGRYGVGTEQARDFKRQSAAQLKAKQRLMREQQIEMEHPGVREFLRVNNHYIESLPYMLPLDHQRRFDSEFQDLRSIVYTYLESEEDGGLNELDERVERLRGLMSKHQTFMKKQRSNPWALSRKMWNTIRAGDARCVNRLRKLAVIDEQTITLITESDFCKNAVRGLAETAKEAGFTIQSCSPDGSMIYIRFAVGNTIVNLTIDYAQFISAYGIRLFSPSASIPTAKEYFATADVQVQSSSHMEALYQIEKCLPPHTRFAEDRSSNSIEMAGGSVFLIFYPEQRNSAEKGRFIELNTEVTLSLLYGKYLINDIEFIQMWANKRRNQKNLSSLTDLHDTIERYRRT